jgi:hypothetical protein
MTADMNPYRTPQETTQEHPVLAEPWFGKYPPAVLPRDVLDVIGSIGSGVAIFAVFYGIPIIFLFWSGASPANFLIFTVLFILTAVLASAAGIRQVELSPEGIIARRVLLWPLRVAWSEVESVRITPRSTVLLAAAFNPHRCCSYSLTSRDQVWFQTGRLWFSYPPRDFPTFYATARAHCAQRAAPPGSEPGSESRK